MKRTLLLLSLLPALGGCAGTDWPRNIYEGIRQHQEAAQNPVPPKRPLPPPDYDQYKREREAQ